MNLYIGGIINNDLANGPGIRTSIFVSGCRNRCENCHNPELWSFTAGVPLTEEIISKLIVELTKDDIHRGLSILGGEPLDEKNVKDVLYLIKRVKKALPNTNIWVWTGYNLSQLLSRNDETVKEILNNIDTLVDGPYIEGLKTGDHLWRGSSNQIIHQFVKEK